MGSLVTENVQLNPNEYSIFFIIFFLAEEETMMGMYVICLLLVAILETFSSDSPHRERVLSTLGIMDEKWVPGESN